MSSPPERHAAVLEAVNRQIELERAATPAPWSAAIQRGKMPVIGVPARGDDSARAVAAFGSAGDERAANARLAVALRNGASRSLEGRRRILQRHAPQILGDQTVCPSCSCATRQAFVAFPCADWLDASVEDR